MPLPPCVSMSVCVILFPIAVEVQIECRIQTRVSNSHCVPPKFVQIFPLMPLSFTIHTNFIQGNSYTKSSHHFDYEVESLEEKSWKFGKSECDCINLIIIISLLLICECDEFADVIVSIFIAVVANVDANEQLQ